MERQQQATARALQAAAVHASLGAPAVPPAPAGQPAGLPSEASVAGPGGGPQRHDGRSPAPSQPDVPSPAAPAASAVGQNLDFLAGSRCRSPDAHRPSRLPNGGTPGQQELAPRNPNHADVEPEPLLFTKEIAAQCLSISVRQLSRFVADGSIKPIRLGPRLVRFTPDALVDFVGRRTEADLVTAWPDVRRKRRSR